MESFRGATVIPGAGPLDALATWFVAAAFTTKFSVLFSFLFGYGLTVQMRRAEERGTAFVPRYLRRLLGLALIGIAHALLLYVGDILVTYALLGVVLVAAPLPLRSRRVAPALPDLRPRPAPAP